MTVIDLSTATFLAALKPVSPNVMQCMARDPQTGDFYVSQTTSAGAESGYSTVLVSHLTPAGKLIDSMRCLNAGHGSTLGVQRVDGTVHLWLTYSHGIKGGPGNQPVRFAYVPGGTINYTDTGKLTLIPKFDGTGGSYVLMSLDLAGDWAAFRWASGPNERFTRRRISDVLAGVNKTYGTIPQQPVPGTFQSFATLDDFLYVWSGTANGEAHLLRRYSWTTGKVADKVDLTGLGADRKIPSGISEPEGANLYRDPATGAPQLLVGVTVGIIRISRQNWVFALTPAPLAATPAPAEPEPPAADSKPAEPAEPAPTPEPPADTPPEEDTAMTWTPPGFTVRPVRNRYTDSTPTLGLILHVQQGNGSPFGWFDYPASEASSTWWAGKTGQREQFGNADTERFWAQGGGNKTYHSIETEGYTIDQTHTVAEPLTTAQVETVAQALAAGHERYGWPLQLANKPGDPGLGWHGMGGSAWGGHPYCPGDVRRAQMPAILARAQEIATPKEAPPVLKFAQNGWLVIHKGDPFATFVAPNGQTVEVATPDVAVTFSYWEYLWDVRIEPVRMCFGGRSVEFNATLSGSIPDSTHVAYCATDTNGDVHMSERAAGKDGYAYSGGFTDAQTAQLRTNIKAITDNAGRPVLRSGQWFARGERDGMHTELIGTPTQAAQAAAKIRALVTRWQGAVGVAADGLIGPGTIAAIRAFQTAHGLTPDAIFGAKTDAAAFPPPPLVEDGRWGTATTDALRRYFKTTDVVRALQKRFGTVQDGIISTPDSSLIRAMQKHYGTPIDGSVSAVSPMVKAMQRALNNGEL